MEFSRSAQEHGINHADLYQKRSIWLRKDAAALERDLRTHPDVGCRHTLDLYGGDGAAPPRLGDALNSIAYLNDANRLNRRNLELDDEPYIAMLDNVQKNTTTKKLLLCDDGREGILAS